MKNYEEWAELDAMLIDSGHHGPFFTSLVHILKDRLVDRSDLHKMANATLRALLSEPFLAERVTMAGYKKGWEYSILLFIFVAFPVSEILSQSVLILNFFVVAYD